MGKKGGKKERLKETTDQIGPLPTIIEEDDHEKVEPHHQSADEKALANGENKENIDQIKDESAKQEMVENEPKTEDVVGEHSKGKKGKSKDDESDTKKSNKKYLSVKKQKSEENSADEESMASIQKKEKPKKGKANKATQQHADDIKLEHNKKVMKSQVSIMEPSEKSGSSSERTSEERERRASYVRDRRFTDFDSELDFRGKPSSLSVSSTLIDVPVSSDKKKDKKKKGKKQADESSIDETPEEKERKKAEKLEAKKAQIHAAKEAKKLKQQEAKAKSSTKKVSDEDEIRMRLEELITEAKMLDLETPELKKGPKKKQSKKETAKEAAEAASRAKEEMEAQVKRLEEMVKKKKEHDRIAAIEKERRETLEQTWRFEQLHDTAECVKEIEEANAEIQRKEKELTEWERYIGCGKLPNPAMCNEMNTYLHLWDLDMDKTSIEDCSSRTADALKLLDNLDELIETVTEDDLLTKLENWKWIRQLFRDFQASSLDVTTYRLMRNVEHNLNRINIPTADFKFKDDFITICLWLRVMLPIPLPNPRRPPKPRVDINFEDMGVTALFPASVDCENAAIRGMYLKYDHLSDLSSTYYMPEVPPEYHMDLRTITKIEWQIKLKYKYDNRDKVLKSVLFQEEGADHIQEGSNELVNTAENVDQEKQQEEEADRKVILHSSIDIPGVPYKELHPTASEYALSLESDLYEEARTNLKIDVPEYIINLRKYVILGGVFHLDLLAQPPQPQDFVTLNLTITTLTLPKKLQVLPFKVVYTPYIPSEPSDSKGSIRKLPEELEEEIKRQEEELDKLICLNIKWPQHVIFLELPIVCRWDEKAQQWSNEEIHDVKHNEDKCLISFRTGVFGIYGLATFRYANLPFQAYDIKPETDESITVQLTAAILMMEFNIKGGEIAITQLQNSPNMTLQDAIGKYVKLHQLKRMMKDAGIDIFPAFDAFCYVDGSCEKHWPMERHLYFNMAQIANCFNFSWSRWNLTAGRRKIVLQIREYFPDKGKQKNHQMLLVTPLNATYIECSEVSQVFSEKELDFIKFSSDLYHLMKNTNGIFVRNKINKACKPTVFTLAQFLIAIRVLSFS